MTITDPIEAAATLVEDRLWRYVLRPSSEPEKYTEENLTTLLIDSRLDAEGVAASLRILFDPDDALTYNSLAHVFAIGAHAQRLATERMAAERMAASS